MNLEAPDPIEDDDVEMVDVLVDSNGIKSENKIGGGQLVKLPLERY